MMAVGINTYPWVQTKTALLFRPDDNFAARSHVFIKLWGRKLLYIWFTLLCTFQWLFKPTPTRKNTFRTWAILSLSHFFGVSTGRRILFEPSRDVMTTAATSYPKVIIPELRNTNVKAIWTEIISVWNIACRTLNSTHARGNNSCKNI